jgi:hypothetical protein
VRQTNTSSSSSLDYDVAKEWLASRMRLLSTVSAAHGKRKKNVTNGLDIKKNPLHGKACTWTPVLPSPCLFAAPTFSTFGHPCYRIRVTEMRFSVILRTRECFSIVSVYAIRGTDIPFVSSLLSLFWNKKFWEELIAYFPRYDTGHIENDAYNNSSIVACVFVKR